MIILWILVFGMLAGAAAHYLTGGRGRPDFAQALVVGLAGSLVGGLLISLLSGDGLHLRPSGIIGSIVGAAILLTGIRAIRRVT